MFKTGFEGAMSYQKFKINKRKKKGCVLNHIYKVSEKLMKKGNKKIVIHLPSGKYTESVSIPIEES